MKPWMEQAADALLRKRYDGEIPEEGFCLASLWPGAPLDQRCNLPAGHPDSELHSNEAGTLMWGGLGWIMDEVHELSDPDETVEP